MVIHDLATLTSALRVPSPADGAHVWGTFYDIRRYGGLQIYLRAICGGASLVLSSAGEPVADHLARLGAHGVTHLSGTPSQWRHALMMMPANEAIAPRYVRLSGEIADQAVLDSLGAAFPDATIGHAYASTEAGVVFDVNDGLAGFPTNYVGTERDGVTMKILDGTLRIRSCGAAKGYLGGEPLLDAAGFVDSGHHRAAWRAFLLRRPQGRHHQYRRLEGAPGRDRGGDQSPSLRAHVAGARPAESGHRLDRGCRRSAEG
jgi:non-ribosomal peptide synthetase component F